MIAYLILYVRDQDQSTKFYSAVLDQEPHLYVPGMTEFKVSETCVLGLMPEAGIKRLLGDSILDPAIANGTPRAELYLRVDDPEAFHLRAIKMGARELSGLEKRSWGDLVTYSLQ